MGVVANLLVKISGDSSELRKELASTRKQIRTAFGGEALKTSEKMLGRVKLLSLGFLALGAASVKMAADVQQTRTALVSLLKSTEEADKLLKEVKTFAATTPFEFTGLSKAAQQMVAFGFEAKAVVPILETVGDAVAGLGGDQGTMDSIVGVLGKIQTMGRVTSQEMMQLARQGVNAYQYLADDAGKSVAQIQDDMKKGVISSADAIKGIVLGMNKQFEGGMEAQSKTMLGIWSTMAENVKGVMRSVGADITKGLGLEEKFGKASDWLTEFTMKVESSGIRQAFAEMVPDSVKTSLVVISGIVTGICVPAFMMWAAATVAATWPILAIGAACGIVAGLVYKSWGTVGPFFGQIWGTITKAFNVGYAVIAEVCNLIVALSSAAVKYISDKWKTVEPFFSALWGGIAAVFKVALKIIAGVVVMIGIAVVGPLLALGAVFKFVAVLICKAWAAVKPFFSALWDGVVSIFNAAYEVIAAAVGYIADLCSVVVGYISDKWQSIAPFFSELWDGIVGVFRSAYEAIAGVINKIVGAYSWMKEKLGINGKTEVLEVKVDTKASKEEKSAKLDAAVGTLKTGKGGGAEGAAKAAGSAAKKARSDFEALRRAAESTSKSIESAWLDMTGSQRDILDAWHRDQLAELEKSKAANVNYQRDRTRLEETFQEKLRQLMHNEAKDRAATIKEITDGYKGMYDKLAEMGLKGSAKDLFSMSKAAEDDIKSMSDSFAKMEADFASATDAQKKNILDALNEVGAAYKVTSDGNLDVSEENAKYRLQRMEQHAKDEAEYHRMGRGIQADIDKAYDELSLDQLKKTLGEKEAVQLGHLEATRVQMDTYMEAMKDAYAPIELMFANMAETFRVGFADAISDVIMGVSSLSEAFQALGKSILKVVVDYYAKQLAGKIMLAVFSKKTITEEAAESAKAAALLGAKWAAVAASVSLVFGGTNAKGAMIGISATHALSQSLTAAALAEGGLVTGPTLAMVGEGRYTEAVLPLSDKVMGRLADSINHAGGGAGTNVNVYGDINSASDEDRIFSGLFKNSRAALMGA